MHNMIKFIICLVCLISFQTFNNDNYFIPLKYSINSSITNNRLDNGLFSTSNAYAAISDNTAKNYAHNKREEASGSVSSLIGGAGIFLLMWPIWLWIFFGLVLRREREDSYNYFNREDRKYHIKSGEIMKYAFNFGMKHYGLYAFILGIILVIFGNIIKFVF